MAEPIFSPYGTKPIKFFKNRGTLRKMLKIKNILI